MTLRWLPILALVLGVPVASAEQVVLEAGPLAVLLERDEPGGPCALGEPRPPLCPAWYDPGADTGIGDDTLVLYQSVHRVGVEVRSPVHGTEGNAAFDIREMSVPTDAFHRFHEFDAAFDAATPGLEELVDVDVDEKGQHIWAPDFNDQTGEVEWWERNWLWPDLIVDYDAFHVPYTTYPRDTDYFVESVFYGRKCFLEFALSDQACQNKDLRKVLLQLKEDIPNVAFGAEVHQATVAIAPPEGEAAEAPSESTSQSILTPAVEGGAPTPSPEQLAPHAMHASEAWTPSTLTAGPAPRAPDGRPVYEASSQVVPGDAHEAWLLLAIGLLVTAPLVAFLLYHRLLGPKVLDHPMRQAIRHYVAHHPGCDVASVAAHLALDYKTVQHHLAILRRSGLVTMSRIGRRTMLHLDGEAGAALHHFATRNALRQRVVWMVESTPGVRQSYVARELGITRSTLHAHVALLQRAGLIVNEKGRLRPGSRSEATGLAPAAQVIVGPPR